MGTAPDPEAKWLDGLADWYKQLISLSSGFVGVTVVFVDNITGDSTPNAGVPLIAAWLCFLIAVVLGLCGLRGVSLIRSPAETDESRRQLAGDLNVNTGLTAVFVLGILLTVAAGVITVLS